VERGSDGVSSYRASYRLGDTYDHPKEGWFERVRSIGIGTQDLKIAAIALANRLTPLSWNARDYAKLTGLVSPERPAGLIATPVGPRTRGLWLDPLQ
jgi:hypothetical protein